jgi:hypothetical protein
LSALIREHCRSSSIVGAVYLLGRESKATVALRISTSRKYFSGWFLLNTLALTLWFFVLIDRSFGRTGSACKPEGYPMLHGKELVLAQNPSADREKPAKNVVKTLENRCSENLF